MGIKGKQARYFLVNFNSVLAVWSTEPIYNLRGLTFCWHATQCPLECKGDSFVEETEDTSV